MGPMKCISKSELVETKEDIASFREYLEYLDRTETKRASDRICEEMSHDCGSCECFQPVNEEKREFPKMAFNFLQPNGKMYDWDENCGYTPVSSIFVTSEKPKTKITMVPTLKKTGSNNNLKDNEEAKRRREIKKKLFMDLGIHRTSCGIDSKEKEREESMKRKVAETIVTTYCALCEQNFSSSKMLLLHNTKVHETSTLECHLCTKRFGQTLAFNKHMKTHYGPNAQYLVQCEMCDRKFKDKGSLTTHIQVTHVTGDSQENKELIL